MSPLWTIGTETLGLIFFVSAVFRTSIILQLFKVFRTLTCTAVNNISWNDQTTTETCRWRRIAVRDWTRNEIACGRNRIGYSAIGFGQVKLENCTLLLLQTATMHVYIYRHFCLFLHLTNNLTYDRAEHPDNEGEEAGAKSGGQSHWSAPKIRKRSRPSHGSGRHTFVDMFLIDKYSSNFLGRGSATAILQLSEGCFSLYCPCLHSCGWNATFFHSSNCTREIKGSGRYWNSIFGKIWHQS